MMWIREKLIGISNPGYNSVTRDKKTGQFVSKSRRKRAAAKAKRLKIAAEERARCGKSAVKTRVSAEGVVKDLVGLRNLSDSLVDQVIAVGVTELMRRILTAENQHREDVTWI
jgi:hypothetical protein